MEFTHLHVHTEYSLLDGSNKIKEYVARVKELGMDSAAITDHGVMYGVIDFYRAAREAGINPILGCEVYVAPGSRFDREVGSGDDRYYHLVLLAENNQGYSNLMKIVSKAFVEGFYYKPRVDLEHLDKYQEGIDYSHEIWAKQKGIITAGTYTSQKDRDTIRTNKRKGNTFSFLAYTYGTNGIEPPNPYSVAYFDEDRIREDVKKAKQLSDVVIVSAHWGDENVSAPTEFQKKYAKLFADLGVDVVVGEHPHVIQPVTWMDGKDGNKTLVIYSLGNFLNGMLDVNNVLGGMIRIDFVKDAKSSEISIQNVKWEPLITHYTGDAADIMNTRKNFTVYKLSDYSEELAEQHGLNGVDGQKVRLNDLYARTKKAITEIPVIEKGDTK